VSPLSAELQNEGLRVYFIFNAYWEPLDFELPPIGTAKPSSWRRWIDTFQEPPEDIVAWRDAPTIPSHTYRTGPRSVVVLWSRIGDEAPNVE
jgi:glycogen operon protein